MRSKNGDVLYIDVDDKDNYVIKEYIENNLHEDNPYLCSDEIIINFSKYFKENLPHSNLITDIKNIKNRDGGIPVVFFSNLLSEPKGSILAPSENRGYDYGGNPNDRQKIYFYSEWTTWLISTLFEYKSVIHPSEHGGNNRFHLISPIPNKDNDLREIGASTGGGMFYQHSDATVYTELKSQSDINDRLFHYNTSIENLEKKLNKTKEEIYDQILCKKFIRVDATILKGILNVEGKTLIGTPYLLKKSLIKNQFSKNDVLRLSNMPIAHIAGPADGFISGFVGDIIQPIFLDDKFNIIGTCINSSENRMVYVGESNTDENLFFKFLKSVREMDLIEFTLYSDNLLLIPNRYSQSQSNFTHGRTRLSEKEYRIPVGNGMYSRRMHCRQYVTL
jgi:hypothetical protein